MKLRIKNTQQSFHTLADLLEWQDSNRVDITISRPDTNGIRWVTPHL